MKDPGQCHAEHRVKLKGYPIVAGDVGCRIFEFGGYNEPAELNGSKREWNLPPIHSFASFIRPIL
jgi:hypothetical protein